MNINERVKEVRTALKLNQKDFGEKIAVSQNYLSNIEKGYRDVTEKILKIICLEFNVNENWLRTGEGEMFAPQDRQSEIARLTKTLLDEEDDSFKNRLVSVLANLTEDQWEMLADIAEKLAKK